MNLPSTNGNEHHVGLGQTEAMEVGIQSRLFPNEYGCARSAEANGGDRRELPTGISSAPVDQRNSEGRPAIAYLGSKSAQANWIANCISLITLPGARVADLFSGTGAVTAALKASGFSVVGNDHLLWAFHAEGAVLLNDGPPTFPCLDIPIGGIDIDRYDSVLRYLNSLPPVDGFIVREYSPLGQAKRRYFTPENAGRIAAVRQQLSAWSEHLSPGEFSLLISDLLVSSSAVSNTAGTFGSYLKRWKKPALFPLQLRRASFMSGASTSSHEVYSEDANHLVRRIDVDAIYADPPYTKRQYAAYYHILETIAAGDEPPIGGATGLRPWEHLSSPYCYRRYAASALNDLVSNSRSSHFFLSYNDEGQIRHPEILEILSDYGKVVFREYPVRRYRSNGNGEEESQVVERLYHLDREGSRSGFSCL